MLNTHHSSKVSLTVTMKAIRFARLPDELHIGHEAVFPRNPLCSDLKECSACKRVSPDFVKCARAHVTCRDCIIEPDRRWVADEDQEALEIRCKDCAAFVPVVRVAISRVFLRMLKFGCGNECGFEGNLEEIKEHLEARRKKCIQGLAKKRDTDAAAVKEMHSVRDKLRGLEAIRKINEDVLQAATAEINEIQKLLKSCQTYPAKLRATLGSSGMLFIECRKTHGDDWRLVAPHDLVVNVQCLPLRIKPLETADKNNRWLSIQIAPASLPKNVQQKLHISVKLHDRRGGIKLEKHINTYDFESKRYIHPCFEKVDGTGYLFSNLVILEDLFGEQLIIDDSLCVSIELRPLDEAEKPHRLKA